MVSEKLKLGSDFQIDHSDKTDTFDVLKHFTGIDLEQERDPRTILNSELIIKNDQTWKALEF